MCIGNTSSALMESLLNSVPVVITPSQFKITQNPIPDTVDKMLYSISKDYDEVVNHILYFLDNAKIIEERFSLFNNYVNNDYFIIPRKKNVSELLKFNSKCI